MIKKSAWITTTTIGLAGLLATSLCHAASESYPLWEAGMGVAGITLPDYRGSDETSTYALPIPFFVYRGKFLKADRNGVRSTLFDNDKVEINISLNGTLPVHSRNNAARRGMSDLSPTVELGPTASINLWNSADDKTRLDFRTPLRAAITVNSAPRQIGWVFSPNLNLGIKDPLGLSGWNLGLLGGPIFNDRRYNAYFYSVSAADATATRPAYAAPGGYGGSQATMTLSKRFPRVWAGSFLRYDTLAGAKFEDSPLVKKRNAVSAGFAVSWVFGVSSTRVSADE